jgi:hypothetical protein
VILEARAFMETAVEKKQEIKNTTKYFLAISIPPLN